MGALALPEHSAFYPLPDDSERCGLLHSPFRSLYGHAVAPHGHTDALGEPYHGHLRRHGTRISATVADGNERKTPLARGIHHQPPDVEIHNRCRRSVLPPPSGAALLLRAYRHHLPHRSRTRGDGRQHRPERLRTIALLHNLRVPAVLEYVQRPRFRNRPLGIPLQRLQRLRTDSSRDTARPDSDCKHRW